MSDYLPVLTVSPVITTTSPYMPLPPMPDVYEEALRRILRGEEAVPTYSASVVMRCAYIGRHRA